MGDDGGQGLGVGHVFGNDHDLAQGGHDPIMGKDYSVKRLLCGENVFNISNCSYL